MIWICTTCGRCIDVQEKPDYCYACRMTYMEKVSDEEAKQAGIAFEGVFEFPFDVAFEPYTKWAIEPIPPATLTEHQERIMQIVRRKCRLG